MKIYGTDTSNPLYAEICDFYYTLLHTGIKAGLSHKEAKRRAFDAIELRYCIKRSRAEQIVYAMMKVRRKAPERTVIIANNKELITILEEVNDAYIHSK